MATSEIIYKGDLRTEATHLQSGEKIITDAPVDNQGKGQAFSPTDLLATSLGSCMLTIMGIAARERGIDLDGIGCSVTKIMGTDPRRVTELHVSFDLKGRDFSDKEKAVLEHAAKTCPVFYSLHPEIRKEITFQY
ncbi:OsmC family protein [Arcticibacter sp. MXS-1]|uniref:OsmC family protein n=1 Tax=Arcticibacter sp. MXS-1 TaxID=3341726 RepID=UPI0035A90CB2